MVKTLISACLVLALAAGSSVPAQTPDDSLVNVTLVPDHVDVGTFYRGAKVQVSANVARCDGAVLILQAGNRSVTLNRKGRVAGVWLNVAQVKVSNVPDVYILAASDRLEDICSPEVRQQLGLGLDFLRGQMKFTCEKPLTGSEFDEFLKLKSSSGTYNTDVTIKLAPAGAGRQEVSAVLPIPATIPPQTYNVLLYCFIDGKPVERGVGTLIIERVGLARFMANLAHEKAALYGVLAIVVAMVVGIGMGVIFSSMPKAGH
jgi:uncharacterized protein (TIGR02186 family)